MKSKSTLFVIVFFLFLNLNLNAQPSAGIGLTVGSEVDNLFGVQLKGNYDFEEPLRASIDLVHFFSGYNLLSDEVNTLNANVHYKVLYPKDSFVYLLLGGNRTRASLQIADRKVSRTKFGVNVGIGAETKLKDSFALAAELKYVFNHYNQVVFGLTCIYRFEDE